MRGFADARRCAADVAACRQHDSCVALDLEFDRCEDEPVTVVATGVSWQRCLHPLASNVVVAREELRTLLIDWLATRHRGVVHLLHRIGVARKQCATLPRTTSKIE
jgi:hypothetical protein